jgi:cytochrome c oxidase subunit II
MKKFVIASLFTVLVLFLAACGGDDDASSNSDNSTPAHTVDLLASNWDFDKDTYTVPAGEIKFNLVNEEGFHGIEIEGAGVKIEKEGSKTANLEAGEYTIRCVLPCGEGHAEMTAQLIVE